MQHSNITYTSILEETLLRRPIALNRPFYSSVLCYQAFEQKRGWNGPRFETNLTVFLI